MLGQFLRKFFHLLSSGTVQRRQIRLSLTPNASILKAPTDWIRVSIFAFFISVITASKLRTPSRKAQGSSTKFNFSAC